MAKLPDFTTSPWYIALFGVRMYLITYVVLAVIFRTVQADFMLMALLPGALGYLVARIFGVKSATTTVIMSIVCVVAGVIATYFSAPH